LHTSEIQKMVTLRVDYNSKELSC